MRPTLTVPALCVLLLSCTPTEAPSASPSAQPGLPSADDLLLIDTHNDVTSFTLEGYPIGSTGSDKHTDIQRLRKGGVDAIFFAAYVAAEYAQKQEASHRTLAMIDTIRHDIVDKHPDVFRFATTAAEIREAQTNGKIAALIGIEGGHAIEDSLRLLRTYFDLGVRYMTLTHSNTNNWADSSGDRARHGGLNDFGREVVREMNRLGMMVDVSHVSDETFWDALNTSEAPLIASHSSARAITNVPRNMTDEMIKAMAQKGGVIQINFYCGFISEEAAEWLRGEGAELRRKGQPYGSKMPRATLADVVAHIDHAVKIGGIDAVGIGSDFDGIPCAPTGLADVGEFPNLTQALRDQGYSTADIQKIYGGNFLRVMERNEAVARRLSGR